MHKIGFIGLGNMGTPIALRLNNGQNFLYVYDADGKGKFPEGDFKNIMFCKDLEEVAKNSDILFTCLPDIKDLRSVLLGKNRNGAVFYMGTGSLCVDLGSSDPLGTVELEKRVRMLGIDMLDAPISGGVKSAKTGELTIMVGGSEACFERVKPFLQLFGKKIAHVGKVGSGQALKCLNNLCSATGLLIVSECLLVAQKFGIDPRVFVEVVNASTGRNNSTENKLKQFILSGSFDSGFSLSLMNKDLNSALKLEKKMGKSFPLSMASIDSWEQAERLLKQEADHTEIIRCLEDRQMIT